METKYKIHACYILSILIATIIVLASVKWSNIPNLSALITFALTVTSIVLAVLAIGYSIYSNTAFTANISTMSNAAQNVSQTATELSAMIGALSQEVKVIPSSLESLEGKIGGRLDLMMSVSSVKQLDQGHGLSAKETEGIKPDSKDGSVDISLFMGKVSKSGEMILLACLEAYEKKVEFDLFELCKKMNYPYPQYMDGFLVGIASCGIINYKKITMFIILGVTQLN